MKIIELKSSNIKRLKAVELKIDENQNLIMITGRNGQGKSSVLDSIWYALGGRKASQDKPIRDGEEKAEVELTIKSEKGNYVVKRSFTDKGSYLTVTNSEGAKYSNPQELLDFIVGNLSFDPLEFSRMDSKKQVLELTKIVGLDFSKLDEKKKQLTEDRLLVGREEKTIGCPSEEELANAVKYSDKQEISVSELSSKLEKANEKHNLFLNSNSQIDSLDRTLAEMENQIKSINESIKNTKAEIERLKGTEDTAENIDSIRKEIENADEENHKIRESKMVVVKYNMAMEKKNKYAELTENISKIDEEKKTKLSKAKMPVDGLSWDEDKVFFNGIPYDQISSAEQLKVSMAIAMATNPKLRMIQIRDGSLLDKENLKVIGEMTKDKDFQAFVEKVDETGKVGIYIEDGEINKINN